MKELRKDVKTNIDLSKIIDIPSNDRRCIDILGIIHPSTAKLQEKMLYLQDKFKKASEKLDSFYYGITEMQSIINTVNTLSSNLSIKEQQNELIHDYESFLSKHDRLAEKLHHHDGNDQVMYTSQISNINF